jgi:hypothetical protein
MTWLNKGSSQETASHGLGEQPGQHDMPKNARDAGFTAADEARPTGIVTGIGASR